MTRSMLWILMGVFALAPTAFAEDEKKAPIAPEQVARVILLGDGTEQAFVAQYLERADQTTLLDVQAALRSLAPQLAAEITERAKTQTPSAQVHDLVNIEVRIIEVPSDSTLFDDVGLEPRGGRVTMMDDTDLEVLLSLVHKGHGKVLSAPRITVYDRQSANVSVVNQISFIQDFDVEATTEGSIADPVIGVAQEGVVLNIRAVVGADKKTITVDFDGTWAQVMKPMAERQILMGKQKLTIQLPEIEVGSSHVNATLPSGGSMLVRSSMMFGKSDQKVMRAALISASVYTATRKELDDLEKEVENAENAAAPAAEDDEKAEDRRKPGARVKKK